MIVIIDNYDSFTYNLVQRLGELDPTISMEVYRNDAVTLDTIAAQNPSHIIISPGPCTPREAGISCSVIAEFAPHIPILGVCLGHQCLAQVFGATIIPAPRLMHGKTSMIHHYATGLLAGMDNPFEATRYHSLIVERQTVPSELITTAWTDDPGEEREIMGLRHTRFPCEGVQFHPESFLTTQGSELLRNFIN